MSEPVILSFIFNPKSLHANTTPYPSGIIQSEAIIDSLNFLSFSRTNKLFVLRVDKNFIFFLFLMCLIISLPQFEAVFLKTFLIKYSNFFFQF